MLSPSVALLRTQSDDRLVALAAGGHERAFEAIVERYRRPLLRHARRYLPDARAEDALQQALLSAWTALRRGDDVHELRPWLHRIVHNTALNALRVVGYDYDELRETLEGSGGPAEVAERRAVMRGTLAGLAALPERQRDALLQIAVEGRSQDEVAEELGLSQGAVRQLVHRARTALRAAATAVVPLPIATWLATAGAGGSATLAKAGAVAVLAGGAMAGPAVVHDVSDREQPRAAASPRADAARDDGGADVAPPVAAALPTAGSGDDLGGGAGGLGDHAGGGPGRDHSSSPAQRERHDKSGSSRRGDGDDDRSDSRHGDDDRSRSGRRGDDATSGSGGGGDPETSDSGPGDDGTSGAGHDDDDVTSSIIRPDDDSSGSRDTYEDGTAEHGDDGSGSSQTGSGSADYGAPLPAGGEAGSAGPYDDSESSGSGTSGE